MFTEGQSLTFTQAAGTAYEQPAKAVTYVGPYLYGYEEHLVIYPEGETVAVLAKDLA